MNVAIYFHGDIALEVVYVEERKWPQTQPKNKPPWNTVCTLFVSHLSHSSRLWNKAQDIKLRHKNWPLSPLSHYHQFCQSCCLKSEELVTQPLCISVLVKYVFKMLQFHVWKVLKALALQTTQFPKPISCKNCLRSLQSSQSQEINTFICFYCFGSYS